MHLCCLNSQLHGLLWILGNIKVNALGFSSVPENNQFQNWKICTINYFFILKNLFSLSLNLFFFPLVTVVFIVMGFLIHVFAAMFSLLSMQWDQLKNIFIIIKNLHNFFFCQMSTSVCSQLQATHCSTLIIRFCLTMLLLVFC